MEERCRAGMGSKLRSARARSLAAPDADEFELLLERHSDMLSKRESLRAQLDAVGAKARESRAAHDACVARWYSNVYVVLAALFELTLLSSLSEGSRFSSAAFGHEAIAARLHYLAMALVVASSVLLSRRRKWSPGARGSFVLHTASFILDVAAWGVFLVIEFFDYSYFFDGSFWAYLTSPVGQGSLGIVAFAIVMASFVTWLPFRMVAAQARAAEAAESRLVELEAQAKEVEEGLRKGSREIVRAIDKGHEGRERDSADATTRAMVRRFRRRA